MISKTLIGISTASLILSLSLGWLLKGQYEKNGALETQNSQLNIEVKDLALSNSILNTRIDELLTGNKLLISQIRQGEDQKRLIRDELEATTNELRKALSDSPEFQSYPLPARVSGAVSRQLDRLWPASSDSGENRNEDSEADSP